MAQAFKALSPTNQFAFTCPIFNVEVKMRGCIKLHDLHMVNNKPEVRKGCQACIRAGKCPADVISRAISFGNKGVEPDDYGSESPVSGKLRRDILERIAPVMVPERTMDEFGVPDAERELIRTATARIHKMIGTAPAASHDRDAFGSSAGKASKPTRRKAAAPKSDDRVNKAAETGDLAAAL